MTEAISHVMITLVAIPVALFLFQRMVGKGDKADDEWKSFVKRQFAELKDSITACNVKNDKEHDDFYTARSDLRERVKALEMTHHLKGCDQPE